MKFSFFLIITLFSGLSLAKVTPYLLKPEVAHDNLEEIRILGEKLLGREFTFEIDSEPSRLKIFKDFTYRSYECTYFDNSSAENVEIYDCMVRIITESDSEKVILIKYEVPEKTPVQQLSKAFLPKISFFKLHQIVGNNLRSGDISFKHKVWYKGKLAYLFNVNRQDVTISIFVDPYSGKILGRTEDSILHPVEAEIYPVYEEAYVWNPETETYSLGKTSPEKVQIKGINQIIKASQKPYFKDLLGSYSDDLDTSIHEEAEGKPGAWNYNDLMEKLEIENPFSIRLRSGQNLLDSQYVSVMVHPSSADLLNSNPYFSPYAHTEWIMKNKVENLVVNESTFYNPIPTDSSYVVTRNPEHDLKKMVADPSDALHVFQGTNEFFQTLKDLGFDEFTDEELKVRAYLYDQNPLWKDNAFYTSGTINFTSYSSDYPNYARDKTVIWHELGHSIFEKLAGRVRGKKGNGHNEGFADFISHLVFRAKGFAEDYAHYKEMRYYSNAIFNIANEVHDDGEVYVGVLKDILEAKIKLDGQAAFPKTLELVLTTLKFLHGSSTLSEQEFFDTMILVDSLKQNEFKLLILQALKSRNFSLIDEDQTFLEMTLNSEKYGLKGKGTRYNPFVFKEDASAKHDFSISAKLIEKKSFMIPYPHKMGLTFATDHHRYLDISTKAPRSTVVENPEQTNNFDFSVRPVCLNYNETLTSCITSVTLRMRKLDSNWTFAKRRIYIRVEKQD